MKMNSNSAPKFIKKKLQNRKSKQSTPVIYNSTGNHIRTTLLKLTFVSTIKSLKPNQTTLYNRSQSTIEIINQSTDPTESTCNLPLISPDRDLEPSLSSRSAGVRIESTQWVARALFFLFSFLSNTHQRSIPSVRLWLLRLWAVQRRALIDVRFDGYI